MRIYGNLVLSCFVFVLFVGAVSTLTDEDIDVFVLQVQGIV